MKILFVDRAGAHSIWSLVDSIAEQLIARGDQVLYCRLNDSRQLRPLPLPTGVDSYDITIPYLPLPGLRDIVQIGTFSIKFTKLLKQWSPVIVHTHFAVPAIFARVISKWQRIPRVVSTQHELYGSMSAHLRCGLRLTAKCADSIVFISHTVAESFGHREALPTGDMLKIQDGRHGKPLYLIIRNGIDLALMDRICSANPIREKRKIVCVGRMVPVKGQEVLLRSMPMVLQRFSEIRLKLIGSGPQEGYLKQLSAQLGIAEHIEFTGWLPRENVLREIATAQIMVVPSGGEGFGLVVAEAMACRTPLVVSRIAAFREVFCEREDLGWFFEPGSEYELTERLLQALNSNDEALRRAAESNDIVRWFFSQDFMVKEYLRLYQQLVT